MRLGLRLLAALALPSRAAAAAHDFADDDGSRRCRREVGRVWLALEAKY